MENNNLKNEEHCVICVVSGTSFGDLVIVKNVKNPCKLCKYSGKTNDKLPCSWCSDYIGHNGYYR